MFGALLATAGCRPRDKSPGTPTVWVTDDVLDSVGRDLHQTLRGLPRRPAFTLAVVLTLALGIGATTAIFSVVNGVVIKPLPYPESEALVTVMPSALNGDVRNDFSFTPQMLEIFTDERPGVRANGNV